jgi:dTDP-glucose 4,6-dehydratase
VLGTQVLLDAAVRTGVGRFLQVSTDEVYGSIERGSWDESCAVAPSSPYSASKAAADLLAVAHLRTHGLPVLTTRFANNYGPRQYPDKIIPLFLLNLFEGRTVPLYGDGGHVRDWLHVDDHCRALALVLAGGRPGEIYHVGGGTELTNRELAERLVALCGAGPDRIRHVTDRKGHDRRYSVDDSKIRRDLGYAPASRSTRAWRRPSGGTGISAPGSGRPGSARPGCRGPAGPLGRRPPCGTARPA